MLAVIMTIMTITVSYICSANSYCDNNDNNRRYIFVVLKIIVTIIGRSMCSVSSYCDNNDEVYI